jgi:hypothetical protein
MKNWTSIAAASFMAVALLVPASATAQRHASPGSDTGRTAGPRDGGGGSDSGGSSGGSSAPSSMPSVPMPRTSSMDDNSQRTGRTAASRRERGDRPQIGTAAPRTYNSVPGPSYQHSTRPYPYWWYSAYAPGFGFASYDLWSWGYRPDLWWYQPYGYRSYRPYGYGFGDPYGYGYGYGYGGGSTWRDDDRDDDRPSGSVRLRVNPSNAKVYIDGALVGVVDDFDGLTNHLELDPGKHQLELRAPGYQSFVTDISVSNGKTVTTRAKLKKDKP